MIHQTHNLFLVGMMGAGKTAVGRQLAARLGRTFVDADHEIQARTGVSVPVIFEVEGEAGFRRREELVLDELSLRDGLVIATGGGAVLSALTRSRLKERGVVVYLYAKAHDLWLRTRNDRGRPLLRCADPKQRLEELLDVRDPLYRDVAHLVVETGRPSVAHLVELLVERLATVHPSARSAPQRDSSITTALPLAMTTAQGDPSVATASSCPAIGITPQRDLVRADQGSTPSMSVVVPGLP